MRIVGAMLFLVGGAATGYSTWQAFERRRPLDVAFGLAAPLALVIAVLGLTLVFVPDFL